VRSGEGRAEELARAGVKGFGNQAVRRTYAPLRPGVVRPRSRACQGGALAAVGGCDAGGEEVALAGAPGDGLAALHTAVCRLEPGTLFCNK
jgi:hypothetical protein